MPPTYGQAIGGDLRDFSVERVVTISKIAGTANLESIATGKKAAFGDAADNAKKRERQAPLPWQVASAFDAAGTVVFVDTLAPHGRGR